MEGLPDMSLSFTSCLIGNDLPDSTHFGGIRLGPQTSNLNNRVNQASLSAEQWTDHYSLAIKFCADVFPAHRCPSLKPFFLSYVIVTNINC